MIGEHRVVHEAHAAVSRLGRSGLRQHRGECEPWMALHPLEHPCLLVDVVRVARAPVEMDVAPAAGLEGVAQHRLQRREAGATGDHQHRTLSLAVAELADGSFDPQQRSDRQLCIARAAGPEQPLGETAATHPPHVQLEELAVVRGARDGEAAAPAAREQHIEVLSGVEAYALDRRQPQQHLHHIGRERREGGDAARERLDLDVGDARNEARFHREVGCRARLAQQDVPGALLLEADTRRAAARITDLPRHEPRAARAAVPGLAAVRQVEPRGECRLEHRLIGRDHQGAAVWLDAYVVLVRAQCPQGGFTQRDSAPSTWAQR